MTTPRRLALAACMVFTLACGGLLDQDTRVCMASDKACAEHIEKRLNDATLDAMSREQARVLVHKACEGGEPSACRIYGKEIGTNREGFPARVREGIVALQQSCDASDTEGCFQVARLASRPGPEQDLDRALTLYSKLCEEGVASACNNAGVMAEKAGDDTKAAHMYERSCGIGDDVACSNHALMLDLGRGVPKDQARAQKLWEKLCSDDSPQECQRLSLSLRATGEDRTRPTQLSEQACNHNYPPACFTLGYDHSEGRGRAKSTERALQIWEVACKAEEERSCNAAGVAYDAGVGTSKDTEKAKILFQRACTREHGGSCYNLAQLVPDDEPRLVGLACQYGHAGGCNNHGVNQLQKGNQANARDAYARACELGSDLGCKNLGWNCENKEPTDFPLAFKAYTTACDRGKAELCNQAASMLKDPTESKDWYKKACDQGYKRACRKL